MNSEVFVRLSPSRLIVRCAVPSMISMAFGALYSVADGFFVGRFVGQDALAAINIVMPVLMIVFAFSNMIATGSSVHISMLLGEGKQEKASAVFSFSVVMLLLISCFVGILGFLFAEALIRLLAPGATPLVFQYSVAYLRVHAAFSPLLLVFFATDNYLRVCGREKLSMLLGIITQVLNILLDFFFIVFLNQGVRAAALASCISMALGSVVSLMLFSGKRMDLHYVSPRLSGGSFLRILANGSSEFFSNISASVMSIVLNLFLLRYGGTTAVAAFSVVMYVDSVVGMLIFGLCDALQPAISYCCGAELYQRVRAICKRVIVGAILLSILSMLFMLLAGGLVAPLFIKSEDTALLEVSITAMKLFSISYLVGWIDMCFSSFFTAMERPGRSFLVSVFGTLLFPVLFLFVLTELWGLRGVWLMPTAAGLASGLLTIILAGTMKLPVAMPEGGCDS